MAIQLENTIKSVNRQKGANKFDINWFINTYDATATAAVIQKHRIDKSCIVRNGSNAMSYLTTLGLFKVLFGEDDNLFRPNAGSNYSPLTMLEFPDAVETANNTIHSCISKWVESRTPLVRRLNSAIGELHDNVWSHGKSTGFSVAQIYPKKNCIEFSVADLGGGFLPVLQRAKIPNIKNAEQAIKWCIQKGNSSAKFRQENKPDDGFAQRLPSDISGSPIPSKFAKYQEDNAHQGIGLFELVKLIKDTKGRLQIASGDAILTVYPDGDEEYTKIDAEWHGVLIAFRIPLSNLLTATQDNGGAEINNLLTFITGE